MADEKNIRIHEIEIILRYVQDRKVSYLKRMKYEGSSLFIYEENKLFEELEEFTSAEYLKTKWKVVNGGKGKYTKAPEYF